MRVRQLCSAGVCLLAFTGMLLAAMQAAEGQPPRRRPSAGRPGETNTPPARGERPPERLEVGDAAPDFTLPDPEGKQQVTLSSFKGKQPVVLIFGSIT